MFEYPVRQRQTIRSDPFHVPPEELKALDDKYPDTLDDFQGILIDVTEEICNKLFPPRHQQ